MKGEFKVLPAEPKPATRGGMVIIDHPHYFTLIIVTISDWDPDFFGSLTLGGDIMYKKEENSSLH